ncbi:MAG: hypothetical protein LBJ90_01955 [Treponema sp.]|jgi:hypothetical protein|nr:hypothetical protein [Treponema sp.]
MKKIARKGAFPLYAPKKAFAPLFFFCLFLACGFTLSAQESPAASLKTGPSLQRLSWNKVEFAAWYEVTVEAGEPAFGEGAAPAGSGLVWRGLIRERRELSYIDCSLVPGRYRYHVQAFNILGHGGEVSEWTFFDVRPALGGGPVQRLSWSTAEFTAACVVVLEQRAEGEGSAGTEDHDMYREILREPRGEDAFIEVSLPPGRYRFQVSPYDVLGRPGKVSRWEYFEIFAAAPKPEETVPKHPETKLFWNGFAEILYAPQIPLLFSFFNETYNVFFQPEGAVVKAGMLISAGPRHALGFDLAPSWNYLYADKSDYDILAHLFTLHLNLVYHYNFSALPLSLRARAGGGFSMLYDFHFENLGKRLGESVNTWIPSVSAGLSLQWFFRRPLYLTLGTEYLQIFSVDNFFLNFIRPSVGIGVTF